MLSPDLDHEAAAAPDQDEYSVAEVGAVRQIIQLLDKTAKASRIYDHNNDLYQRFWNELVKRLTDFLPGRESFALKVSTQEIRLGDEVVYKPRGDDDNFAFRLYKDGLRKLEFARGITDEELERFMSIVTTDFDHGEYVDQDIVSLIWESEFKHIHTVAVESFAEEVSEEEAEEIARETEAMMSDLEEGQMEELLQQSPDVHLLKLDAEERREYHQVSAGFTAFEERNALRQGLLFEIDPLDQAEMKAEVENVENEKTPLENIAEILFELFRHETPDEYPELLDVALGILEPLLQAGDLQAVNTLLSPLRLLTVPEYARAFLHHSRVLELFRRLGHADRLAPLTRVIGDGSIIGGPSGLFQYISFQVPENALSVLVWTEKLSDAEMRRAAVDGLITVMDGDLEPFRDAVRSQNPQLVADVIHGMGRVGDIQSLEVILGAFSHEDPKVRLEVLLALRSFETPRAREIMASAMNDADEDVRLAALRYLTVHRDKQAVRRIMEQLNAKSIKQRSFKEKRALFMALAHIQHADALPALSGFFQSDRQLDIRRAAAHGLAVVGGPEARRLLDLGGRDNSPELAAECKTLIKRLH